MPRELNLDADIDLGPYTHLAARYARVSSRPSAQRVLAADGLWR